MDREELVQGTELCDCRKAVEESSEKSARFASLSESVEVRDLSVIFKMLGDNTRLAILLCIEDEPMCVCDIASSLNLNVTTVSRQLNNLRACDLVRYDRRGSHVYYHLADEHVKSIIDMAYAHVVEEKQNYGGDYEK